MGQSRFRFVEALGFFLWLALAMPLAAFADPTPTPTPIPCGSDTRYWVGNGGSWNDASHWACESGGSGGASVPACTAVGDTYQGTNDCVWDAASFSPGINSVDADGLCCRNADYSAVETFENSVAAWFNDGFIISGSLNSHYGVAYDFDAGPLTMTATSGTHSVVVHYIPSGGGTEGGIDFHGSGTYGDNATWQFAGEGFFYGLVGNPGQNITLGYGVLQLNGYPVQAWEVRNGHGNDPHDAFTINADSPGGGGGGPPTFQFHQWSMDNTMFVADNSELWCGGVFTNDGRSPSCIFEGAGSLYNVVAAPLINGREAIIRDSSGINELRVYTADCASWICEEQPTGAQTLTFEAGSTNWVGQWNVSGSSSHALVVRSSESGEPWTLNCGEPAACVSDYLVLSDSICTGTTPCYAGDNSTVDQFSLEHGWALGNPPPTPTPTDTPTGTDTPTPTPTIPPPPGCCAFSGVNIYGATCVDAALLDTSEPMTVDVCNSFAEDVLGNDEVLWFNPDYTCDPAINPWGVCPPLDPATPSPTPAPSGCCVFEPSCGLAENEDPQPAILTDGGVCFDPVILGDEPLSEGRCTAAGTVFGCTVMRFQPGGSCDSDCAPPTETPTPTPTPPPPPGCCAFSGNNVFGAYCFDARSLESNSNEPMTLNVCELISEYYMNDEPLLWYNPDVTCSPEAGDVFGFCPPLDPSTPTPTPNPSGCCVWEPSCTLGEGADQPAVLSDGICFDPGMVGEPISEGRCQAVGTFFDCQVVRWTEDGTCDTNCGAPTPTPTALRPGCCAFAGNNLFGATCIDLGGFPNASPEDPCGEISQNDLSGDEVLWFNPNASCDPEPGDMYGFCPPLDPSTPTPTPAPSGCCVLEPGCSNAEGGPQPITLSDGVCFDPSILEGSPLTEGRCNIGSAYLGCDIVRFVADSDCASNCGPTPTPTGSQGCGNTRYWVGGAGDASDSAHWSCVSGGSGGASVPECIEAGDTFQGTNDCVWDNNSSSGELPNFIDTEGLCCRTADWSDATLVEFVSRFWFSDGFIVSGSLLMSQAAFYDWSGVPIEMTATSGEHDVLIVSLPNGGGTDGGIDFHGSGTYGDDATWNIITDGTFYAFGWMGHNITLGYGNLNLNGLRLEAWEFRKGYGDDPPDSFTFDAGFGTQFGPTTVNANHLWEVGPNFVNGDSTVWCGGVNGNPDIEPCTFDGGGGNYFNVAAAIRDGSEYIVVGNMNVLGELNVFNEPCTWQCDANDPPPGPPAMTIEAGSTQTVASWNVRGRAEQRLEVRSSAPGEPWTLHCNAFACISDYITLSDSICTGSTPCYAGPNSIVDQFSLDHGWSTDVPPVTPTPTTPPKDCSTTADLCDIGFQGTCGDCLSFNAPDMVEHCGAEFSCFVPGDGCPGCPLGEACSLIIRLRCGAECACLEAEGSPTSGPSPTPTAAPSFVEFESGQVRPLAMSPDGERLFAVNTPDNRLEIFDIDSSGGLTLSASVPVGLEPVALAALNDEEVWVVNHLSDSVSIVDVSGSPPRLVRTLLVGDEPRDIVFAGANYERAFITTAHRGQNDPNDPRLSTEGIGRADVWVFNSTDLGDSLAGERLTKITLFSDTPRALAVGDDGAIVYAAAFHSGNRTTAISSGRLSTFVCEERVPACFPNELPAPHLDSTFPTSLIVKQRDDDHWVDRACDGGEFADRFCTTDVDCGNDPNHPCGRNFDHDVMFDLPDNDVFVIDADANPPVETSSYVGVGTILFNMAVNPANDKVYVTNTEAINEVRFEGSVDPNDPEDSSVQGHLHEARITVLGSSSSVTPRHLNTHIDYDVSPAPAGIKDDTLAQPTGITVSSDGDTIYVAALGSSKIGVLNAAALEAGTLTPDSDDHITVEGGGPTGLVLDEGRDRLYVMTRFDNGISSIDLDTRQETRYSLHNPEPESITEGRKIFYDATFSSSNGEASCASCHIFGDFDSLAWDLGDPNGVVLPNPNPPHPGGIKPDFQPLKGPMTTQTLRGIVDHGPMHWRGDRTGAFDAGGNALDTFAAFMEFNGAFESLLGRTEQLTTEEMETFTEFILQVVNPPNPIRNLDNSLTDEQQAGSDFFFNNGSSGGVACNDCHAINRPKSLFGTNRGTIEVVQSFKVAQFRNDYQKVGMFGTANRDGGFGLEFNDTGDFDHTGDQVRGFGYLHDGTIDNLFRFMQVTGFNQNEQGNPEGFPLTPEGDEIRRGVAMFLLAADTNLFPIVGQQVTLTDTNAAAVEDRIDLLLERCGAPLECDLVVKGTVDGDQRGWMLDRSSGEFHSDVSTEPPISDEDLRLYAPTPGQELTYTAVPPGTGERIGIDRDLDTYLDADEIEAESDPADPSSTPP